MKKKWIPLLALALTVPLMITPLALAASEETVAAADALYELGLFQGTGVNEDGTPKYDLDRAPTRNQAVIMLVRLLRKEEEALSRTWELPFEDVDPASNMAHYIGYAYANGYTNGTSPTTYSGGNLIRANQYIAFVLRALGYVSGEDFTLSNAGTFADSIGLIQGEALVNADEFTRGDIALISYNALNTPLKDSDRTLREFLALDPSVPAETMPPDAAELPLTPVQYDNYEEAYAAAVESGGNLGAFQLVEELSTDEGTAVSYELQGLSHGPSPRLWFVCTDGTAFRLPLPQRSAAGESASPVNLQYDAESRTFLYEASIPEDVVLDGTVVQPAGTYQYTFGTVDRTIYMVVR